MSEPKFTSWHVEKCGGRIEINMGDYSIALRDSTENMELAVFIAAAPEMYDLLEWMFKQFDASDSEEMVALGWKIEELLKKARGER
jgi:hypothetical protein